MRPVLLLLALLVVSCNTQDKKDETKAEDGVQTRLSFNRPQLTHHRPPHHQRPVVHHQGFPGQQFNNQQFPNQQFPGAGIVGQPFPGQFPGQQFPGQIPGQQFPGHIPGQQFPGHIPGQQFPGQIPGHQFPGGGFPAIQPIHPVSPVRPPIVHPAVSTHGQNPNDCPPGVGCLNWCPSAQPGSFYCCKCDNEATVHDLIGPPTPPKPGICPKIREHGCPEIVRLRPGRCSNHGDCPGANKCCYDVCLRRHTCKKPLIIG